MTSFVENNAFTRIKSKSAISNSDANYVLESYSFFKESQALEDRSHVQLTQKNAAEAIENLIAELKKIGVKIQDVYLKFNSKFKVSALLTVDRGLFYSEEFDKVYEISISKQKEAKKDFFEIGYYFACQYSEFFEQNIASDGYFLKRKTEEA